MAVIPALFLGMKVAPLNESQQSDLAAWRATALERMPYMAMILLNFRPLNAPGLGTFACDQHMRLYIDFDAVAPWGPATCAEALLHECCHIFAHDSERAEEFGVTTQTQQLWGLASDAANNDDLVSAGCAHLVEIGAILPSTFTLPENETAEFYMQHLIDQFSDAGHQGGADQQGNTGQGAGTQDGGSGAGESYAGCGSVSGGESAPCELDPSDSAGGAAPAATATEQRVIDIGTATAIREHAGRHPGSVPGSLTEMAERRLAPSEVPWRQVLASAIRRASAMRAGDFDTTYSRRNRRRSTVNFGDAGRALQPGIFSPTHTLVVVRDTSGSMTDVALGTVTSEIEGISRQLGIRGNDLRVLDVDVDVHAVRSYKAPDDLNEASGRGGTDMTVGLNAALAMRPTPGAVVVITDGYTPMPTERVKTPVVFCIVGAGANDETVLHSIPEWIRVVKVGKIDKVAA